LIGKGVSLQWKLSTIDSIEMNSTALLQEELDMVMNLLIGNDEIWEILVQHPVKRYTDKPIGCSSSTSSN
jgi:hypothetical protein